MPIIPTLIFYKRGYCEFSVIFISLFYILGFINLISKNFRNIFFNVLSKIFTFLGSYVSKLVLYLGYIFVVIPTALLMKITKRDRLKIKKQTVSSYWINIENAEEDYERQF
jgi:predicted membrane protein